MSSHIEEGPFRRFPEKTEEKSIPRGLKLEKAIEMLKGGEITEMEFKKSLGRNWEKIEFGHKVKELLEKNKKAGEKKGKPK